MVVSRAEELYTFEHKFPFAFGVAPCCMAAPAKRIIHDLESALAQRDKRIAELYQKLGRLSDDARALVHDLESAVSQRDKRIAELEKELDRIDGARHALAVRVSELSDALTSAQDRLFDARAEVPEWCKEIVRRARRWNDTGVGREAETAEMSLAQVLDEVTPDQLRDCGIEVP